MIWAWTYAAGAAIALCIGIVNARRRPHWYWSPVEHAGFLLVAVMVWPLLALVLALGAAISWRRK